MYHEAFLYSLRRRPYRLSIDVTTICASAFSRRKGHFFAPESAIIDLLEVDHIDEWQVFIAIVRRSHDGRK